MIHGSVSVIENENGKRRIVLTIEGDDSLCIHQQLKADQAESLAGQLINAAREARGKLVTATVIPGGTA